MNRFASMVVAILIAACSAGSALAQEVPLNDPLRFGLGGPNDESYRLYDRSTDKLVAKTDALIAQVYVLPENGETNAYVVLAEGWESGWGFGVWKANGPELVRLFHVGDVDRQFEAHDLNGDGQLDFTFYATAGEELDVEFGLVAQRDYVSGPTGYGVEIPTCPSARNALARQRLAYAIERNKHSTHPQKGASAFLQAEATRMISECPER